MQTVDWNRRISEPPWASVGRHQLTHRWNFWWPPGPRIVGFLKSLGLRSFTENVQKIFGGILFFWGNPPKKGRYFDFSTLVWVPFQLFHWIFFTSYVWRLQIAKSLAAKQSLMLDKSVNPWLIRCCFVYFCIDILWAYPLQQWQMKVWVEIPLRKKCNNLIVETVFFRPDFILLMFTKLTFDKE